MQRYVFTAFFLFLAAWLHHSESTFAQSRSPAAHKKPLQYLPGLNPEHSITQYLYDNWTDEAGLPQQTPRSICQTPDGYLWLATYDGLVRFDGARFKSFNSKTDSLVFNINEVRSLAVSSNGSLWIGSSGGGLLRLRNNTFTRHIPDTVERHNHISAICEDSNKRLWIGTERAQGGLLYFTDTTYTSYRAYEHITNVEVSSIVEDSQHRLWVGTKTGLYCITGDTCKLYTTRNGLKENFINALATDNNGNVWIGTEGGGLSCWRNGVFTSIGEKQGLKSAAITSLYVDRQNTLWIGTNDGGLNRLSKGFIAPITKENGLSSNTIIAIFEDNEGSLWVGTGGSGVDRIKESKFIAYGKPEGFSSDLFSVVYQDSKGGIWSGSFFDNDIHYFHNGQIRNFTTQDGLPGNPFRSMVEDRRGRMWFGTSYGGALKYENGTFTAYTSDKGLVANDIRAIYEDANGKMWFGTFGGGLSVLSGKNLVPAYTTANGLGSDYIFGICEDSQGRIWLATRGGGVTVVKPDAGVVAVYNRKNILPNDNVIYIARDRQNTMWMGTKAGVVLWRDGTFFTLNAKNGLPDEQTLSFVEDANGDFWLGTATGILFLSKYDVEAFVGGQTTTIAAKRYNKSDGMRSTECNGGGQPAAIVDRNGAVWLTTMKGLVTFKPSSLRVNTIPPPMIIEEIEANGTPINISTNAVELPESTERIIIRYTALSFLFPDKVRFQYRMDGFDREWNNVGTRREAEYTNLRAGTYIFRVRGCNNDGVWNETSLKFSITPRPYESYWFFGLVFLGVAGAVAGFFSWRLRQLQQRERELAKLVDERTAEIQRQVTILDEQARDIEIANGELTEKNTIIEEERQKSEQLLLNILPATIADRLKHGESIIADKFESVTIMFADIVGFTKLSARISPEHLVENLSMIFTTFDALAAKYKLEKIKTIGDAYMLVGGLPEPTPNHTEAVARMALEMQVAITDLTSNTDEPIFVRVGIHCGPVVAGVIGVRKFAYDLWGDSVNIASRMESSGEPGKVHCSEAVYQVLKDKFEFEERGEIEIKGKGKMRTYFIVGVNP